MSRPFVHLHCHSHYSLLDGQSKVPDLVKRVKGQGGSPGDHRPRQPVRGRGVPPGGQGGRDQANHRPGGVAPRTSATVSASPGSEEKSIFHQPCARNGEGVRNLMRLSSKSFPGGFLLQAPDRQGDPGAACRKA
ncbi:MAG: hypothetical protein U0800_05530 [Isosphaeraceae bacterium]